MAIPFYLAMTAAEFRENTAFPDRTAWMACHFSPYGTGLTNLPHRLAEGSLVILNDRMPPNGHDPKLIAQTLRDLIRELKCSGLLLDFQRPDCEETAAITAELIKLPCPVAASELYAKGLDCPVFLPPVPPVCPVQEYLALWRDREIWLEAALEGAVITVTEQGSSFAPLPPDEGQECPFIDKKLHCRYRISTEDEQIRFALRRTRDDLDALLHEAETLGVTRAVGLYQELGR